MCWRAFGRSYNAQHLRPCPLTPAEQKRERLIRETQVSKTKLTEARAHACNLLKTMFKKDSYFFFT